MEHVKSFLKKQKNLLYILGVVFVALLTLWSIIKLTKDLYTYISFDFPVEAHIRSLSVKEKSTNEFIINVEFSYLAFNQERLASSYLEEYVFFNEFAAYDYIKTLEKKKLKAWYKKSDPGLAVLEKRFPWKAVLNSTILVLIGIYFLGINRYLLWKKTQALKSK
jgi:hypothetical protein